MNSISSQKDDDKTNFKTLIEAIKKSKGGQVIGEAAKDKFGGEFCDAWRKALSAESFSKVSCSLLQQCYTF